LAGVHNRTCSSLCLQAGSWDCLKSMDGHKGSVNSVAVHPNGSVALSVGRCGAAEAGVAGP
jgi:hypothetical protein